MTPALAQPATKYVPILTALKQSARCQKIVDDAVQETLKAFSSKNLASNQIAVTLIDLANPNDLAMGSFRGGEQIYPASVIKLFYLVAAHRWMEDNRLADTAELRRGMRDMIVESLNEATGFIVDSITGTTSGPELPEAQLEEWYFKRNVVNRYFASLGFTNINVNRKPWCEGPYGREMQSVKAHTPNHRNWLTTDATARLMTEIVTGRAVTPKRCEEMKQLLHRDLTDSKATADGQTRGFTGAALPSGAELWSKAGWTSQTRHDAAYVELPGGRTFVLVTFTVDHANEREIIPTVAKRVIQLLEK